MTAAPVSRSDGHFQISIAWIESPTGQRSKLPVFDTQRPIIPAENHPITNRKAPFAVLGFNCDFGMQMPVLGQLSTRKSVELSDFCACPSKHQRLSRLLCITMLIPVIHHGFGNLVIVLNLKLPSFDQAFDNLHGIPANQALNCFPVGLILLTTNIVQFGIADVI